MDPKLKDLLNEKLRSLPAGEANPGFDRDQSWETLAARLALPKRCIRLPQWSYAAAALVAGLLLGGPLLRYLQPEPHPAPAVGRTTPQPAGTQAVPVPRAGNPESGPAPVAATAPAAPASGAPPVRRDPVRSGWARPADTPRNGLAGLPVPPQQPEAAGTPPAPAPRRAPRAVHLLDLQSEDRTAVLEGAAPVRTGSSFSLYLSPKRLPDGRDAQAPASVLRP